MRGKRILSSIPGFTAALVKFYCDGAQPCGEIFLCIPLLCHASQDRSTDYGGGRPGTWWHVMRVSAASTSPISVVTSTRSEPRLLGDNTVRFMEFSYYLAGVSAYFALERRPSHHNRHSKCCHPQLLLGCRYPTHHWPFISDHYGVITV